MSSGVQPAGVTGQPIHTVARLPVTTRLDGSELAVTVHEIRATQPGPTLTVISGLHGSEWFTVHMVQRFVELMSATLARGVVVAVPVANPMAFEHETRMTPDRSDEPDLNRVWPGGPTWITEQIADRLATDVIKRSDAVIDFHAGPWGSALTANGYGADLPSPQIVRKSVELAVAFGHPIIRGLKVMSAFPGPRSLEGYASGILEIPCIAPNLGGLGFSPDIEEQWILDGLNGLRGVAIHMGLLDGAIAMPPRYFHFTSRGRRVVPRRAGLVEPHVTADRLGARVPQGQVLGTLRDPYTFAVVEELVAPADGVLFGLARSNAVRPGDWAFFVADERDADSRWVESIGGVATVADRMLADGIARADG